MDITEHDVIVVGAGNAATCAALSAQGERRLGADARRSRRRTGAAATRPSPAAPGASSITASTTSRG